MTFMGEELSDKERRIISTLLKHKLEDIIEDIDYHTDGHGNVILTNQMELKEKLKYVM
jgi:hypothetical protein